MMFNKSLIKTALKETRQNFLWITTVFLYSYIFFCSDRSTAALVYVIVAVGSSRVILKMQMFKSQYLGRNEWFSK